jgi:CHASE2 domain-containing sensor protein
MPQVELMANVIDNLVQGRYLKRPTFMLYIEAVILLLFCLFASLVLPRFGFINRMGIIVALIFLVFLVSLLCFMLLDLWFKIVYIGLALFTFSIEYSVRDIATTQRSLTRAPKHRDQRMLGLSLQSQGFRSGL